MTSGKTPRTILTCTCEGTMAPDAGLGGAPATQLCRANLDRFRAALASGQPLTVACTQEAPLFSEIAAAEAPEADLAFANIRETAGWTAEAAQSGPKMAALLAMAGVAPSGFGIATLESRGIALVLGRDQAAVDAGAQLAETLDVTVLLVPGAQVVPPRQTKFPVLQGKVATAKGHLGAFELRIDAYAAPDPSSRAQLRFDGARDGATSRTDIVIDLRGGAPLFAGDDLRPGYFRADPGNPLAVAEVVRKASQMVGTFDKPVFIDFRADLCAHSRNTITGCTRCLSVCPTGAILPAGDSVAIDPAICAGCGQCASVCPTGAASYALPAVGTLAARLRAGLRAWAEAGARFAPIVLFHDADHGEALIDAAARFGTGLPAHVLPVSVNEITQVGPETMAAALTYGAGGVAVLGRGRRRHDLSALEGGMDLVNILAAATGQGRAVLIETDDPDAMLDALKALPRGPRAASPATFLPPEDKRGLLVAAFAAMNRAAPAPAQRIDLPKGAPFGAVALDTAACTLCMACTGACPTGALIDNPETPMLRFTESACVQCGLCAATCPEDALTLVPQADFAAWDSPRRILKEEEPFCCTSCGKPFATQTGIARIQEKLAGHWMFSGPKGEARRQVLTMCEDCRVEAVVNEGFDPHAMETRRVRTIEDHIAEEDAKLKH